MRKENPKTIVLTSATSPVGLELNSDVSYFTFTGTKTLASDFVIEAAGGSTPVEGMGCMMVFQTALTMSTHSLIIFTTTINPVTAAGHFLALCYYTGSAWFVWAIGVHRERDLTTITTDANGNLKITDGSVGATQLSTTINNLIAAKAATTYVDAQDSALGVLITALPALVFSMVSGDATIAAGGALSIGASKILAAMIANGILTDAHIATAAAIALTKLAASTPNTIPKFGAAGKLEPTAVTPTQLAFLDATSSVQTQLNALGVAVAAVDPNVKTLGIITGTAVLTSATIKNTLLLNVSGGGFTTTLPLASTMTDGYVVKLACGGHISNVATIACNASDYIVELTNLAVTAASVTLAGYNKSYTLQLDKATKKWYIIDKVA